MTVVSTLEMAAPDAQLYWLSDAFPNDQFLVYRFEGTPDLSAGVADLRRNAQRCADLKLRVDDCNPLRYPRWRDCGITPEQFVVHPESSGSGDWPAAVDGLDQLDATTMCWRVHVFPPDVVVVQIVHALADGTRSAALAAAILGRDAPLAPVAPPSRGLLAVRAVAATRAHRQLVRDTAAGLFPAPGRPRPPLSVNAPRSGSAVLRTVVVDGERLRRPTVTVGALTAISQALGGYLGERGEDVGRLGAEVPLSSAGAGQLKARNNFRNVSVDLHPDAEPRERAALIAGQLAAHRRRTRHRATLTADAAFAAVPAWLLRWGVRQNDPASRPAAVAANTVVSSVNRGAADLSFGGSRVVFTAGFPALSPVMGLTHGVHGTGGTVAVSVHADPEVVDVDDYLERLADALLVEF